MPQQGCSPCAAVSDISGVPKRHEVYQLVPLNVWGKGKIEEKVRYMHFNPVERGLVAAPENWDWGRARHYQTGIEGVMEIESWWTNRKREALGIFPTVTRRTG